MTVRYISVCSGIEAATVAWHSLGWEPLAFSEIEAFPRAVLKHHYPEVPCHGDFTTIKANDYGRPSLLVGGTPCQSFSVAGLRKGMADERGNLALEYLRLADRLGTKWLVWENVPGVLSSNGGRDFGSFLGGLVQLGYGFAYRVLDAIYFGCACPRPRVFVVGYRRDWRPPAAVLFERNAFEKSRSQVNAEKTTCYGPVLTTRSAMAYNDTTPCILETDGIRRATPLEYERALGFPDDYTAIPNETLRSVRRNQSAGRISSATNGQDGAPFVVQALFQPESQCQPPKDFDARTEAMQCSPAVSGGRSVPSISAVLPRAIVGNAPRYKALGNSMAVPVMRWVGERIQMVEEI